MADDEFHYRRRKYQKDIDLENIDISDEIKNEMLRVYKYGGFETHKGERQKKILVACATIAMINCGKIPITAYLLRIIGLDSKQASGCSVYLAKLWACCHHSCRIYSPSELTQPFLEFKGKNNFEEINNYWLTVSKTLKFDNDPVIIACWLLHHLNIAELTEICYYYGISETKVREISNKMKQKVVLQNSVSVEA